MHNQTTPSDLTLVIGGSGKTGKRVADRLLAGGRAVRIGSRSSETPFNWSDASGWPAVLAGVKAVYVAYYPDLAVAEAPEHIAQLVEACRAAGVEKVVLLSGRGEANARVCEQIVRDSGLAYTLVRASWFNQNFDEGHFLEAVRSGVIALPIGDAVEPFVDCDDIADVAYAALTEDQHNGELYEVTGPELLNMHVVSAMLTRAAGHAVRYQPISLEVYEAELASHMGPDFAKFLTELMREVMDGRNEWVGDGVQRALGREPRSFNVYAQRVGLAGTWSKPTDAEQTVTQQPKKPRGIMAAFRRRIAASCPTARPRCRRRYSRGRSASVQSA